MKKEPLYICSAEVKGLCNHKDCRAKAPGHHIPWHEGLCNYAPGAINVKLIEYKPFKIEIPKSVFKI
jgi:hypothetical protein